MDLRRRLRGPAARPWVLAVGALLLVHGLAAGSLVLLQRSNAGVVLPGTVVAGTPVDGLERERLRTVVADRGRELLDDPVRIDAPALTDDDRPASRTTIATDRRTVGMVVDAEGAADEAWSLGRRGLWRALFDQLRARTGATRELDVPRDLDPDRLERWSRSTASALSDEPLPARVELIAVSPPDETDIEVTPAATGSRVSPEELRRAVEAEHRTMGPLEIRTSRQRVEAPTTDRDLDAALAAAETMASAPVTLYNPSPGADLELTPTDLFTIVTVQTDPEAPEGERLPLTTDATALLDHLGDEVESIETDADEARVELADGDLEIVGGAPGFRLDPRLTAEQVLATSQRSTDREARLPGTVLEPDATRGALRRALIASGLDVGTPIVLENDTGGDDLELAPDQLTELLEVAFDPTAETDTALTVSARGDQLLELLGDDTLAAIETEPREPRFDVSGEEVTVEDGEAGVALDAGAAATGIAELATEPEPRTGPLPLVPVEPELTAAEARDLGIEEEVSSFTTSMVAGQARNRNIRQAADYLDGSLILPGERLSLNEAIGRRTTARGFGEGGFIRDGEIVEVVGGGVSQMATTFMNAAWFAGVELVAFQPHSLYFTQYPVGRESTMSGSTIDVVVENDSPHGILVTTDHSDTHVTVRFWSTAWAEVETWTGEPTNRVPGELRDGFDVRFGRTITYPDGTSTDETYFHRYRPENAP